MRVPGDSRPVSHTEGISSGNETPVKRSTPHVRSADLLGGAQELVIEHNQREYRLRVTAQGKLILTA